MLLNCVLLAVDRLWLSRLFATQFFAPQLKNFFPLGPIDPFLKTSLTLWRNS